MDDILLFVKNVGLPGSLLVGLVIGLYKLGTLAIREIGVPVAMKHCRYLDKSLAIMDKISEKMEAGICRARPVQALALRKIDSASRRCCLR